MNIHIHIYAQISLSEGKKIEHNQTNVYKLFEFKLLAGDVGDAA